MSGMQFPLRADNAQRGKQQRTRFGHELICAHVPGAQLQP